MIQVRFDPTAEQRLVMVVEPPEPKLPSRDDAAAADRLFSILARAPDPGVTRAEMR
jgi:hypothetical protein